MLGMPAVGVADGVSGSPFNQISAREAASNVGVGPALLLDLFGEGGCCTQRCL